MNTRLTRVPALITVALFCASMIGPTFMIHSTAKTTTKPAYAGGSLVLDDPEAIFEGARIVHNVTVNGEKGMRVHAKFRVKYGQDVECMLIAYFYFDDADQTKLKTSDPNYRSKDGTVSAHTNFTPAYDPAEYADLQIFVPYDALNMQEGDEYDLKFYLALYDKEGGRFFGKSGWYKFHLTVPG